ncbi:MAG: hypothetical protein ABIT05_12850 [Chitinophagaceae bacterium]
MNKQSLTIILLVLVPGLFSCSSKNITGKYYYEHEQSLNRIEGSYKELYRQKPFTVAFTAKDFKTISLEIITDTLSFIYEFSLDESRLADTLVKYGLPAPGVLALISEMQSIRCTWVNMLDYYVDQKKNRMVFMSVKSVALNSPFAYKKYYILAYFSQPQYFDDNAKLLDKKATRRLRKINGHTFTRINDKVCYTISGHFR